MMNSVVGERHRPPRAARRHRRSAGKTGTTQSYRDAWFVGFTGNFVGGVWFGNDDYTATNDMTGGSLPAMTWKEIMTFAHQGLPLKPIYGLPAPANGGAVAQAPAEGAEPAPFRSRNLTDGAAKVLGAIASDVSAATTPPAQKSSMATPGGGASPVVLAR